MPNISSGNSGVTKKYKIKITASAQKDIRGIWEYIAQNNPLNAGEFILEIEKRICSLSTSPERNPVIPEGELLQTDQYRHFIYKNYRIVYRVQDEIVYVLRIFHGAKLLDLTSSPVENYSDARIREFEVEDKAVMRHLKKRSSMR